MAVIDKINRIGARGKRVLTGPGELTGPSSNSQVKGFQTATGISGPVDLYEVTDGSGGNEGSYTINIRPLGQNGFTPALRGIGRVALVKQPDGVNTATAQPACVALKKVANSARALTLGPVAIGTSDRFYIVVERRDASVIKYQLEVDLVLDAITISAQPPNRSVTAPTGTTFTVTASTNDGGTLSYAWQVSTNGGTSYSAVSNGGVYSGAATATLTISNSTGLDANKYRVVISSTAGAPSQTSTAGTLTVAP